MSGPTLRRVLFLGLYPKPALERIEPSVDRILQRIEQTTDYQVPEFGVGADLAVTSGEMP